MKKPFLAVLAVGTVGVLMFFSSASATIYDIAVTDSGDSVRYRYWGGGSQGYYWDPAANPNIVYHQYSWGYGDASGTALSFALNSFSASEDDIVSVSLNYKILNIWTDGRDDVSNLNNSLGTVYASGGTGWKLFDVTDYFKNSLADSAASVDFYFEYTGYSGFQFASSEGGDPAFLRITTECEDETPTNSPVPEPATMLLFGTGIAGLAAVGRRKRS